jgi:hypothetical protein
VAVTAHQALRASRLVFTQGVTTTDFVRNLAIHVPFGILRACRAKKHGRSTLALSVCTCFDTMRSDLVIPRKVASMTTLNICACTETGTDMENPWHISTLIYAQIPNIQKASKSSRHNSSTRLKATRARQEKENSMRIEMSKQYDTALLMGQDQ